MNSSASLINISISISNPEGFKGIDESGEITAVFDSNAKLSKPTVFGRTVNAKLTGVFNKHSHQKSEEKYTYQKSLAERRAGILTGKNTDPGEVEDKLLELVDQCSQKQEAEGSEFIKVKSLNKQVQRDVRTHLSNEIKKATSTNRLEGLHGKIQQLESKIDKDVMVKLQNELDHQCDRIAKQIEAHIETADLGSMPPEDTVCAKCRCVIAWSKAIQTISPKSFARNHKELGQLLSKTYSSGLGSVTPHENDLGITKQRHSKVKTLSKEVKDGITQTLGEKPKHFKKMNTATTECLPLLKRKLELVPKLVTKYCHESKKLERFRRDKGEKEVEKSQTQKAKNKNILSRSELKDNKKDGYWGKHKLFRLLDKNYQNKVGIFKKKRKDLSKQMDETKINLRSVQWQIAKSESTLERLSGDIVNSAKQYGWSIQKLDQFNDLQQTNAPFPSKDQLLAVIENKPQQSVVKKSTSTKRRAPEPPKNKLPFDGRSIAVSSPPNTQTPSNRSPSNTTENVTSQVIDPVEKLKIPGSGSDLLEHHRSQLLNNPSIASNPENLESLIEELDNTLKANQGIEESLSAFMNTYVDLMQTQEDGNHWRFHETFSSFQQSCSELTTEPDSIAIARSRLYELLEKASQIQDNELPNSYTQVQSQEPTQIFETSPSPDEIVKEETAIDSTATETTTKTLQNSTEPQSPDRAQHTQLFQGVLNAINEYSEQPSALKSITTNASKAIPRPLIQIPAKMEATQPLAGDIYDKLDDLANRSETSSNYGDDDFNDEDSAFGDQPLTLPEAQKDKAIQDTEKMIAAREPFYSMTDDKIRATAKDICNLEDLTKENIEAVIDHLKRN